MRLRKPGVRMVPAWRGQRRLACARVHAMAAGRLAGGARWRWQAGVHGVVSLSPSLCVGAFSSVVSDVCLCVCVSMCVCVCLCVWLLVNVCVCCKCG